MQGVNTRWVRKKLKFSVYDYGPITVINGTMWVCWMLHIELKKAKRKEKSGLVDCKKKRRSGFGMTRFVISWWNYSDTISCASPKVTLTIYLQKGRKKNVNLNVTNLLRNGELTKGGIHCVKMTNKGWCDS